MHRSRIGIVLVDHPGEHHDAALAFWAGVQGVPPAPDGPYAGVGQIGTLNLEVQRLEEGQPRIHLDIESDDVAAEVSRLEALGATVLEQRDGWVIMADPGGVVFCVVGIQTGDRFAAEAHEWP
jgi:glyoxalase superfamily protein